MNKNIIIAGAIAIGLYLFSQGKSIFSAAAPRTTEQRIAQKLAAVRKAAAQKIGKKIGETVAQKVAAAQKVGKKIGKPTTYLEYIAARRKAAAHKAAIRKAAAQKIGKKIGKTAAHIAAAQQYVKRQRPRVQRPRPKKKQIPSKLFSGAEKSRVIPYKESSKHSYYGSKSRKVLNEGYMEKRYKADQKQAQDARIEELRAMFPLSNL